MKCNVCGAVNEDYLEYCEKCAAPLHSESTSQSAASSGASGGSWGFVRSPVWNKPEFNANTISENDLPEEYLGRDKQPESQAGVLSVTEPKQEQPGITLQPQEESHAAPAPVSVPVEKPQPAAAQPMRPSSVGSSCPACGAKMIAGQKFCSSCGTKTDAAIPLSSVSTGAVAAAAPIIAASVPTSTTAASSAWTGYSSSQSGSGIKYADPIDDSTFSYSMDDEEDSYSKDKRAKRPAAPVKQAKGGRSGSKGGYRPKSKGKSPSRKRNSGGNTKLILIALGALAAVALVVFGIVMLLKGGLFSSSAITDEPVIEQGTTSNGDLAYNITVYAKKGSTVHFEGGSIVKDTPVTGKSVTYSIPEQVWVPNEPVEDTTLEIYPDITVINKKGESEAVTFADPIVINIPSIQMTVTSPNTPQFSVTSPTVDIAGTVGDTSAAIFINDQQAVVDETGAFAFTYTLTQPGTNTIDVEARKNGYAINRSTFTVDYSTTTGGGTSSGGSSSTASPGDTSAAKSIYFANTSDVNVRKEANSSSEKLGTLSLCEKVFVISADSNDWYKIVYSGGEAYVSGAYIKKVSDISSYSPTPATIKGDGVNARTQASSSADKVGTLSNGTSVSLISQDSNGWSLVEHNGKIFYVSSSYVQK